MRKILLSLTTAAALSAMPPASSPANAIGAESASAIRNAIETAHIVEPARRVCRHRLWTSRRVCFWEPGWRR